MPNTTYVLFLVRRHDDVLFIGAGLLEWHGWAPVGKMRPGGEAFCCGRFVVSDGRAYSPCPGDRIGRGIHGKISRWASPWMRRLKRPEHVVIGTGRRGKVLPDGITNIITLHVLKFQPDALQSVTGQYKQINTLTQGRWQNDYFTHKCVSG
ncbi:hypothetical protein KCP78_21675 [Salmonella enterica subsp. enterica]|nr:hypothetical protein KCP78_21675 [Salmonella enterica subsp. enterica]